MNALSFNFSKISLNSEQWIKRAVICFNSLLVVFLAFYLANLTWQLMPEAQIENVTPQLAVGVGSTGQAKNKNSSLGKNWNIAQYHLFGEKSSISAPVQPIKREKVVETTLNLTLKGVFADEDVTKGIAIIGEPNGKEKYYQVNDRLPGRAQLKEIFADRIILYRNGRLETLKLPKQQINLNETIQSTPSYSNRSGARRSNQRRSPLGLSSGSKMPANASFREYKEIIMNNPQRIPEMVQFEPHSERGRFMGYVLRPGKDDLLFARTDLEPGDIVTGANGITIDNPAKGFNVMRSLAQSDVINLEIRRNGVPMSVMINLK